MPPDYGTVGKQQYRENIHGWIKRRCRLWNADKSQLIVSLCDLLGSSVEQVVEFWESHGVGDGKLVAVDREKELIARLNVLRPGHKGVQGNIFELLHDPVFDDVGVFLLDGLYEIGSSRIVSQLPSIKSRVRSNLDRFPEIALCINASLDAATCRYGKNRKPSEALYEWTDTLAKGLSNYLPRRVLDPAMLLSKERAAMVDDPNYVDMPDDEGTYFIYRSNVQRMACIRLLLM